VGVVGPNGAGKSTLIKLLTVGAWDCQFEFPDLELTVLQGETSPQEGTVYKHPALRVGYVSQHATHHIGKAIYTAKENALPNSCRASVEHHLEKTPIAYIQWRFQDGHDRGFLFSLSPEHVKDQALILKVRRALGKVNACFVRGGARTLREGMGGQRWVQA
jgi:elongation factor 3